MFCPKCGSLLKPKQDGKKRIMYCSCGYKDKGGESVKLKENIKQDKKIEVVDDKKSLESLPLMSAECPKCGNDKAHYWLVQTRAADEPETKFLKCPKCKHTWRDYD